MSKIFSERLKELRQFKNLSQAKLGKDLGANQQAIDRWERNVHEPDMEMIVKIAEYFGETTDYLLGLEK